MDKQTPPTPPPPPQPQEAQSATEAPPPQTHAGSDVPSTPPVTAGATRVSPAASQLGSNLSPTQAGLGSSAAFPTTPSYSYAVRPLEIVESIRSLHELHQLGGLTAEEFIQAKQAILDSSSSSAASRRDRGSRRGSSNSSHTHPRHRKSATHSRSSRPRRRSSSSSSSSSSSTSDKFIVVPRARVWRNLNADSTSDGSLTPVPEDGYPHAAAAAAAGKPRTANDEDSDVASPEMQTLLKDDPTGYSPTGGAAMGRKTSDHDAGPHAHVSFATNVDHGSTDGSEPVRDGRGPHTYGTFLKNRGKQVASTTVTTAAGFFGAATQVPQGLSLNSPDIVKIRYFNSRGATSDRFGDVELTPDQMRPPLFLFKGGVASQAAGIPGTAVSMVNSQSTAPQEGEPVTIHPVLTAEERRLWDEMSSRSTKSTVSFLEQSLNWYWIDVSGRDASRRRYNTALKFLTRRFKICESFLVEREHSLLLPQIIESPTCPGQYLLNLRVATDKISISADSVMELTNRWIIIVDLNQHFVMTLHRVDTMSMALLRLQWKKVMAAADVSFQEFLLKIIDDAIYTYQLSLDVHEDLLDKCESKIFTADEKLPPSRLPSHQERAEDVRILHHFAGSSRSPFLRHLLDEENRTPIDKNEMNAFLHHLHRRTSVQHRMLNLTRDVLGVAFTKLRLCSKELADQMCSSCIELRDRALEVRDDAKTILDLNISIQSFRTNELMAVLTRVSILFTPCTFIAGVYGMNFRKNFPELDWNFGYPFFWIVCFVMMVGMQLYFFKGKL